MGNSVTAEDLAQNQREIAVSEFMEKNRQMLGLGSDARALVTSVKEGVDNAIDASEEAGILPDVSVIITESEGSNYTLTIRDNGPGITKEQIPKIFGKLLYGSRFGSKVQRRGQQGIGISAVVLYSQLTVGGSATIISKTQANETASKFEVGIDTDDNTPVIHSEETASWDFDSDHGTQITVTMRANFRARSKLHEYITHTAIINPHLSISLEEPSETLSFDRSVDELPPQPEEILPHPHGIELGTLQSLLEHTDSHSLSGFLQNEFTRVGPTTADSIIAAFMDRHQGRYLSYTAPEPSTPLTNEETPIQVIKGVINRKPADATEMYASSLCTEVYEKGTISHPEIREIASDTAEYVAEETGTTMGDTVQEKAAGALWELVFGSRNEHLTSVFQEATSQRKTEEDISALITAIAPLLRQFEEQDKGCLTPTTLEAIVEEATETASKETGTSFGETARENIEMALWDDCYSPERDPPLVREISGNTELERVLIKAMRDSKVMSPPSKCLSPIGKEALEESLKTVYSPEFTGAVSRDAEAHGGDPFIVEAAVAYGGDVITDGQIDLLRFANRVPLVYKEGGCAITDVVTSIRWNNYNLSDKGGGLPQGEVVLLVHVGSTNVPFTSESKDAVAGVEVIEDEIEKAVRGASRKLKKHIDDQQSRKRRQEKKDKISDLIPVIGEKTSSVLGCSPPDGSKSIARIMNIPYVSLTKDDATGHTRVSASNYNDNKNIEVEVCIEGEFGGVVEKSVDVDSNQPTLNAYEKQDTGDVDTEYIWEYQFSPGESVEEVIEISFEAITNTSHNLGSDEAVITVVE